MNLSRYVTLDDIVKLYLIQSGAPNNARYNQYMTLAQLAYQELEFDVLKKFTYRYLPVDSATKTVAIPDDMLQYTMIGFVNQVGEVIELTYDPKLVFKQEVLSPVCHCDDCGCTDEVCSTISNVVLSETVVTIPTPVVQCSYSGILALWNLVDNFCSQPIAPVYVEYVIENGFTTAIDETFATTDLYADFLDTFEGALSLTVHGTFNGAPFTCARTASYYSHFPFRINSYIKNGVAIGVGETFNDLAELSAFMTSIGWSLNDLAPTIQTYYINDSPDTWGGFDVTGDLTERDIVVTPTSCSTTTVDRSYTNYCRTCVGANGDIIKECCTYGGAFGNYCSYEISIDGNRGLAFPLTDGVITINGLDVSIATINSLDEFIAYFDTLGFYVADNGDPIIFRKVLSTDVYGNFSSVLQSIDIDFTQSDCLSMIISQTCATEKICNVTVLECGCVVMNDKEINTLYNANIINNTMYERWLHGGDISTTYLQPYNLYGFYNVDMHKGVIQLDPFFKYDTIYLEYYGSSEISTKNFAVPLLAREFILSYIHKMSHLRKGNTSRTEIEFMKKECRAAKHNLRLRWQPPREKQIRDLIKTPPSKG